MNSNEENNKNINLKSCTLESFTVKGIDSPSEHQDMIYNQIDDIQESFKDYWFSLYHEMENEFKSLKILYLLSSLLMIITVIILVAVLCYIKL